MNTFVNVKCLMLLTILCLKLEAMRPWLYMPDSKVVFALRYAYQCYNVLFDSLYLIAARCVAIFVWSIVFK